MLSISSIYIIDSMPMLFCRRACAKRRKKVRGAQYDEKMSCPKMNGIWAGSSIIFVIVRASQTALSSAHPIDTTPRPSMIWPAYCHLGRFSWATVATSANCFVICIRRARILIVPRPHSQCCGCVISLYRGTASEQPPFGDTPPRVRGDTPLLGSRAGQCLPCYRS